MKTTTPSLDTALPEFAYGSVWVIGAGDGDPRRFSSPSVSALSTADAVIHDPGIPETVLELVKPSHYREAAEPGRAIERSIKLAQDGWRVVQLVAGNTMERAIECAIRFAQHNIPFRIAPTAGQHLTGAAPIGLVLVRRPLTIGEHDTGPMMVLVTNPHSETTGNGEPRQAPLSFSMSGLAG